MSRTPIDQECCRMNLHIPKTVRDDIRHLRKQINAGSDTEVIRRAVAAYGKLVDAVDKKKEVIVRESDGFEKPIWLFF